MDNTYNGWKNRQTWNVALWINNDEPLYRSACEFMRMRKSIGLHTNGSYAAFARATFGAFERTPDGVAYLGIHLDYAALDEMMEDLL